MVHLNCKSSLSSCSNYCLLLIPHIRSDNGFSRSVLKLILTYRMPITSTLAARLAKRGIQIQKPTEEIFAEDKGILDEFGSRLAADWDKASDNRF